MLAAMIAGLVFSASPVDVAVFAYDGEAHPWTQADAAWPRIHPEGLEGLNPNTLLVLPDAHVFPAASIAPLEGFVQRGGHLLAVGGPAFEHMVYRDPQGRMVAPFDYLAALPVEHALVDWAAVNAVEPRRSTSQPQVVAEFTPLADGFSATLRAVAPFGWETRGIPVTAASAEHDVIVMRVAGGERATSLVIELRERDGARWMATAPLTPEERTIGLHLSQFSYWKDNAPEGRGGPGDRPHLENLVDISVGFASSHQIVHEGAYTYTLRGLGAAKAGPGFVLASAPLLEGLSPAYKTFRGAVSSLAATPGWEGIQLTAPAEAVSPIARPRHDSSERDYVWQPHVKGLDARGIWSSTPLATTWHKNGATWTSLGWRPSDSELDAVVRGVAAMLESGRQSVPSPELLADTSVDGPCVTVKDGRFVVDGKPWFAHAINYWPLYVSGMETREYFGGWLMPATYDPEYIERDLDTLRELGVNCVSIQYIRPAEAPQLRDFIARCAKRGIKVNIYLNGAHPTSPSATDDLSSRPFMELLRAADLRGNAGVFAYDLAWEPRLGLYKERAKYDSLFEAWLTEQYGSVERAESVWKFRANRVDGKVSGPTDAQLKADGPHTAMAAAYCRFADDLISRRYGDVIRLLRTVDDTHLCGARTGYGGTGTRGVVEVMPFTLTAGAAHLDFTSPEGYGYGPENISDAAFVGQFARWAGNGKPVFWAEFGRSVWNGGEDALALQARLYEAFAEMIERSQADGWAGWWYPGGYRVDERSDYGIVAPDGSPRPSARVLQHTAPELSALEPLSGEGAETLDVHVSAHAPGLAAVVEKHSKRFALSYESGQVLNLSTPGSRSRSIECPLEGLGGIPYEAPMPAECLNAEIVTDFRNGRRTVTALNTGEAAWAAADCSLTIASASGEMALPIPQDTGRFAAVQFDLPPSAKGELRIRMKSARLDGFGQEARLLVGE